MNDAPRRVIGAGEAGGCERWAPPLVGGDAGAPTGRARPLTAAQLEALQRQAWEEAFAQGHAEGLEAGRREGLESARAETQPMAERCRALLDVLAEPLEALDDEVEEAIVALAIQIARQIVRRELRTAPGEVVGAVRAGVAALPSASRAVRLFLHPADVPIVREALAIDAEDAGWRIVEDPGLSRGGCRIESEASRVDATVEGRLAAAIAGVLGGERSDDGDE